MIHKDPPHDTSGHREEMGAVVPRDVLRVDQAEIRLVDEDRGLEAVARSLSGHAPFGDLVEFPMDERYQSLESRLVALAPFEKEPRDPRQILRNATY
jgi:hypothetical protein